VWNRQAICRERSQGFFLKDHGEVIDEKEEEEGSEEATLRRH
jgi:hypothetical protein